MPLVQRNIVDGTSSTPPVRGCSVLVIPCMLLFLFTVGSRTVGSRTVGSRAVGSRAVGSRAVGSRTAVSGSVAQPVASTESNS